VRRHDTLPATLWAAVVLRDRSEGPAPSRLSTSRTGVTLVWNDGSQVTLDVAERGNLNIEYPPHRP
jgi:hypothetical protein